jgi:hypothetical protein
MASINPSSARVTALYKYYHTDQSKFYPVINSADEYPHELYAATRHSAYGKVGATISTNWATSIIRLIHSGGGATQLKTLGLRDPKADTLTSATAIMAITSSGTAYFTGDFQRLGDKVYYNHYDTGWNNNGVFQIRPRTSAQDTAANCIFRAGIPDPNAFTVIERMEDKSAWLYAAGAGVGSAANDRSPLHKFYGPAGVVFTQQTDGATATITFTASTAINLNSFNDGTSAGPSDYIAFNVYRWGKGSIADLRIEISTGGFTGFYYWAPITMTPTSTLQNPEDNSNWDAYDFRQSTIMAEWGLNPYDHQMFKVRIPRKAFAWSQAKVAEEVWSAVTNVRFTLRGNSQASSTFPAKVTINNLRLEKSPPIPRPFGIQWLEFEREECGSSTGWLSTASGTTLTFNYHLARQGVACIEVPPAGGVDGSKVSLSPVLSIDFSAARDLVTFSDGTTAGASHVLKIDLFSKGATNTGLTFANWTKPKIRFITGGSGSANYYEVKFAMGSILRGGGITRAVKFNPDSGSDWTKGGAGCTWTSVDRIEIYGQYYTGITAWRYFMDNLRIERPNASKPVNVFEPVDLLALDASDYLAESYLGNNAAGVWDATTDVVSWWFKWMKYRTHGYGYAIYPDYEHSSIGISSLRLVNHGSKPFGMTIEVDPTKWANITIPAADLSQYTIATWTTTFAFDWPNKFGFLEFTTISASDDDEFSLWIASPDPQAVSEIVIKLHGGIAATGRSDPNNFWEYRISGHELWAKWKDQQNKEKEVKEVAKYIKKGIQNFKKYGLKSLTGLPTGTLGQDQLSEYIDVGMQYLGKDRGGWPCGTFTWRRKDMLLQRASFTTGLEGTGGTPTWDNIRGHTFEVIGSGGKAEVCFDNFFMKTKGALNGTYYYKMMMEDDDGFLSPSTSPSEKVQVEEQNVQLENIYIPSEADKLKVPAKRIYRIGGSSSEWRHTMTIDVLRDKCYDNKPDEDLGLLAPPDAYSPPQAKVMKAIGNMMYYGNIRTRYNEVLPYRLYRSEPYCAYRVSEFDEIDLPESKGAGINGIGGWYNHVLIWTSDSMYTCDPTLSQPPVYRYNEGCIAKRSIAVSDYGVIWLSRNGLMLGDISKVDETFFRPINVLFGTYTETELADAIGFVRGNYYYLFYDHANGKGICCYLPERLFSELSGPFDVYSAYVCNGGDDNDLVYYGRNSGEICRMFYGMKDNDTAITTTLRSKDFTEPGIMYDKYLSAHYLVGANMYPAAATNTTTLLTVNAYCNQTSVDTMPVISAGGTTALRAYANKAIQGDWGQLLGFGISGTNRHKITELALKIEPEQDTEYHA